MENNTSQNQNNSNNSNQGKGNQGQKKQGDEGVLTLLQPHDMSRTVESAMHVFQGHHEKLPELMHDMGTIILKAARRMTTTQLILAAGAITVGAVLIARYSTGDEEYQDAA
ncbi:MAG: hypothetical protein LPK09_09320 [Hymenobacteraceae bacterium]|nr:hypothetical protein [Hymenobacteraceae bacterium]